MSLNFDSVLVPRFDTRRWRHLSSTREVVSVLIQKGQPPEPFRVSRTVRETLDCIAALGRHMRLSPSKTSAALTPSFWRYHLSPWLTSLLLAATAPTSSLPEASSDTDVVQFRAEVLMHVPFCLNTSNIPFQLTVDPSPNSFAISPELQYLLVQGWFAVLREGTLASTREAQLASAWWSSFPLKLKRDCPDGELFNRRTLKIFRPDDIPFLLGYIRGLIPSASKGDFSFFQHSSYYYVFADVIVLFKDNGDPNGFVKAFAETCPGPILIQIMTKALLMRRAFRDGGKRNDGDLDPETRSYGIDSCISSSLRILLTFFDEPSFIADALGTGLLSSLLGRQNCLVNLPTNVEQNLGSLIDLIDESMALSSVFREFVRAKKRGGSRYTRNIQDAPSSLVERWERLEEKVQYIGSIRADLKTRGMLYTCSNRTGCMNRRITHCKRCVRCGAIYCSVACQRKDWNAGHRTQCVSSGQRVNRAIEDYLVLHKISEAYLARNAAEIQGLMDLYVDTLRADGYLVPLDPAYLADFHLIRTGQKNPILVHQLIFPGIPSPRWCLKPILTVTAASARTNGALLPAWRASSRDRLFVVIVIPPSSSFSLDAASYHDIPWPLQRV
ncbi:hypothetical protein PQX77_001411 [Marasmius sp. AFHP31]|nr:hypothetical protein PQX77_001411 [Marasmius sp. AFHP31]